ncbi:putative NADPH-dependent methylglyoxal reductase GRP2 [Candida viswanathii]|uniref:Putative NADPH-dependent methylglyoxal reductase GRP2 n=1 Tax=Candida viswanathii TaxID=5486 RepID=A0A367YS21_9ASCO|nr:putative NADPH-dependent methylglyoxal reductase GRP2 [Candida viswanathii]
MSSATTTTTSVFVSGASGYIAQEIVKQLIQKGYKVVGTVRSNEKGDSLKSNLAAAGLSADNFSYEIVKDISVKGAFDDALKAHPEVTVFLHTASPFHFNIQDVEKELLLPAIEGTNNALSAIKTHGPQIKHVVITSSYVAVGYFFEHTDPSKTVTEDNWNQITYESAKENPVKGYFGSKTYAEKAAWDFLKNEKPTFTLTTVNPAYVFGPQAFEIKDKSQLNTSAELINAVLKLNKDSDLGENNTGYFTDIRDVARAHIAGFENPELHGQRLLMVEDGFTSQTLLNQIRKGFPQLAEKLPVGKPEQADDWKALTNKVDNSRTRELLGFKFVDLKTSVHDTVAQIVA